MISFVMQSQISYFLGSAYIIRIIHYMNNTEILKLKAFQAII